MRFVRLVHPEQPGSNGLLLLGIAVFFVALGLLADAIVDGLSTLAGSLWSVVRG